MNKQQIGRAEVSLRKSDEESVLVYSYDFLGGAREKRTTVSSATRGIQHSSLFRKLWGEEVHRLMGYKEIGSFPRPDSLSTEREARRELSDAPNRALDVITQERLLPSCRTVWSVKYIVRYTRIVASEQRTHDRIVSADDLFAADGERALEYAHGPPWAAMEMLTLR
jgi:hypothetical protein